ncbi:MAG: hypothetical protein AB7O52_19380 [Planctomycetota bacterium]
MARRLFGIMSSLLLCASVANAEEFHSQIGGVVQVNGGPVALSGSLVVTGGLEGTLELEGTALTQTGVGDVAIPPWQWENLLVKFHTMGMINIQYVLTSVGDAGVATVEIEGLGVLTDNFVVTSTQPWTVQHTWSGDEVVGVTPADLPWQKTGMDFLWGADGTLAASMTIQAVVDGQLVQRQVTYSATFSAAAPAVSLPMRVLGEVTVDEYSDVTGIWRGTCVQSVEFLTVEQEFRRGDANADGSLDIGDAIQLLQVLFPGRGPQVALPCDNAGDTNDDGQLNVADAISLLGFLFAGAPALPSPTLTCGVDPTPDGLACTSFSPCP